jgi:hypothetical protein
LREDLFLNAALCDVIREEARAVLLDMCNEASAAAAASGKNNIAVADDGAEKSVARYLGSTVSRINAVGKKEKKKRGDSKLGEKDKRASGATNSQSGISGHNTPASATTERRDLTARASLDNEGRHNETTTVRARVPTPPPAPETTQ